MAGNEKFMFDTIFDELEPIEPELADDELRESRNGEEPLEEEPEEEIIPTFSEEEVAAARQEGFADGKAEGIAETLASIEKNTEETLNNIAERVAPLFALQEQANQEISNDATALSLAVVRKFFPTLNEDSALNEVTSVVESLLGRLINEPNIQIKCNPAISDALTGRIDHLTKGNALIGKITVIAEEEIPLGDCKIEWSSGTAERNLATLISEIDGIIAQNATVEIESLASQEESDSPSSDEIRAQEGEEIENTAIIPENEVEIPDSGGVIEQNIKDAEIKSENSGAEEKNDSDIEDDAAIEPNENNDTP